MANYKGIIVGDDEAGKSTFVKAVINQPIDENYKPSHSADLFTHRIDDDVFRLWDVPTRDYEQKKALLHAADVGLIIVNGVNPNYDSIQTYIDQFKELAGDEHPEPHIMIAVSHNRHGIDEVKQKIEACYPDIPVFLYNAYFKNEVDAIVQEIAYACIPELNTDTLIFDDDFDEDTSLLKQPFLMAPEEVLQWAEKNRKQDLVAHMFTEHAKQAGGERSYPFVHCFKHSSWIMRRKLLKAPLIQQCLRENPLVIHQCRTELNIIVQRFRDYYLAQAQEGVSGYFKLDSNKSAEKAKALHGALEQVEAAQDMHNILALIEQFKSNQVLSAHRRRWFSCFEAFRGPCRFVRTLNDLKERIEHIKLDKNAAADNLLADTQVRRLPVVR